MIVSHKYKYIYIKAKKVAGTSVQIALSKYCGDDDLITAPVNLEGYPNYERNIDGTNLVNHATPKAIKAVVGEEIWRSYFKVTIVRNPWDECVSKYFWRKNGHLKAMPFEKCISRDFNNVFHFDRGNTVADFYIRYERLKEDYQLLCAQIGIPCETLPRMKSKFRKEKRPYWEYYDLQTCNIVAKNFKQRIRHFGYVFGQ